MDPRIAQPVFTCTVIRSLFKRRDITRKDFAHIMQERHEENACEIDGGEFIAQKVCHQRHPPAVLRDALLSPRLHPRMTRALFEPGDTMEDGEIFLWRHRCSFRLVEK